MAHPTGVEPVTSAFGENGSIPNILKSLSFSQIYLMKKIHLRASLCQICVTPEPQIMVCLNGRNSSFPDNTDGFSQMTIRMGIRLHQSWTNWWLNISNRTREKSPSHDMSIMQSVSYRDRSLSRERTPLAYTQELRTGVNGISDYPPNILRVEVVFILRNVSLIAYVSGVTGLKCFCILFPVTGSVCPEITTSR